MDDATRHTMALQGDLRVEFMAMGMDATRAGLFAGRAVHLVCTSPVATDAARESYARVSQEGMV